MAITRQGFLPRDMAPGRNDPCPCGSGKKYKHCHGLLPAAGESPTLRGSGPAVLPPQALLDAAERCVQKGEFAAAEALYRDLLERAPGHVEASTALGSLLDGQGRVDEAEAIFRKLVEAGAPTATAYCNHGVMLYKQGRALEAAEALQRAVSMQPDYAIAHDNLGAALTMLGRFDEAERSIRAALAFDDRMPSAHNSLGTLLARRHDDAALECFDRALATDPAFFDAHVQRATLLREQGRVADAVMAWRRAMTLAPAMVPVWSNLVHTLLYSDEVSAEEVMVWHRRFDKVLELSSDRGGPVVAPRLSAPEPKPRLRIGFLSPDFRRHPVGDFTALLFEHHDRSQLEIFCYHDSVVDDDVGAELAAHSARWVKTSGLDDDELAAQLAGDDLDVLIDLAGHTGLRLRLFARRLAPVQATWLGYPASTGLAAIDFRISDSRADPPGCEALNSERLVRLPHSYFCYRPRDVTTLPGALPALARAGEVTFGSLNIVTKISATTLELWAGVLRGVPRSRLLLQAAALAFPSVRDRLRAELGARGIDAERIEFRPWMTTRHLETYHDVDIALDTGPHNGATTTCEALWMGVPVVTVAGDRSQARMGASILTAAGCAEWIATDGAGYVRIAQHLAGDLGALEAIRSGLRAQLCASPLMDGRGFARDFGEAMRAIANHSLTRAAVGEAG